MKENLTNQTSMVRRFFTTGVLWVNKNKIISAVVLIVLFYLGYYFFIGNTSALTTYQYTTVKRGPIVTTVSGAGQITPNSQVDLKPKVNANVVAVYVKSGDRVRSGQTLFKLDATDAYKQVRDAKTALDSANISLLKLKTPLPIDILNINNSLKQEQETIKNEEIKVTNAYNSLLNSNLVAFPDSSYTTETAPTISGSYLKGKEGKIKLSVFQGGDSGYTFTATGLVSCSGQANTNVAQNLCDSGLYIKWNNSAPQMSWTIEIPNKQSSSYLSTYTAWQTAVTNRDTNVASAQRNIESYKQKLADLTPSDENLDVQSSKIQVEQRKNALLDAQTALSNYSITAPFDGVMASVSVDIGSSAVMASANSSAALGTIVTDKKLAQVILNETDITKVVLGQKAKVTLDAIDGLVLEGNVVEITTLGTVTSGVVTYKAKVAFSSLDTRILPNMSVSVDVVTDSKDDVLYVPNQAVKRDSTGYYVEREILLARSSTTVDGLRNGTSTNRYKFATSTASSTRRSNMENGTSSYQKNRDRNTVASMPTTSTLPTRVPVTIGTQSDLFTEITSGLSEGDRVVIKTVTTTESKTKTAPSVTSLLRPQGATRPGAAGGTNFRAQ